ncbi:MAG: hypothetical protein MUF52_05085 [Syntrophobacteraceae bacterium]|jgi:carboxypeptidase C (cathepsin A)|nr:hypothetical protein [Syntrophobacteraceae bacterium]MCU0587513.1 hypothetical protein [Syntrophobacteraceae bacterium]
MRLKWLIVLGLTVALRGPAFAQEPPEAPPAPQPSPQRIPLVLSEKPEEGAQLSVTQHSIVSDTVLPYTARAGCLPLKDEWGRQTAELFFVSYEKDDVGDAADRPIGFVFNGGPGASSLWLHFGAIGPKRVSSDAGRSPSPGTEPRLADNELSWLAFMDLVFVDPVGTGFSRPASAQEAGQFFSVQEDIRAMSDFIRRFVTRFKRWPSPRFIVGESYGTIRAAGVVQDLFESHGMEIDGLVLVSPALSLPAITFGPGNDLPSALFVPAYTAAAWHHGKLPGDLRKSLADTLKKSEQWVLQEYWPALLKGNTLTESERARVAEGLARFTGLPQTLVERSHLRVAREDFQGELLRDRKLFLSLFDTRLAASPKPASLVDDPAVRPTVGPLVSSFLHHLKDELRFDTDRPYRLFSEDVNVRWDWGAPVEGASPGLAALQNVMNRSPRLRVLATAGLYDLATPYTTAQYTIQHLAIDPARQKHIDLKTYPCGHMPYLDTAILKQWTTDVAEFVKVTLQEGA